MFNKLILILNYLEKKIHINKNFNRNKQSINIINVFKTDQLVIFVSSFLLGELSINFTLNC